MQFINEAQFNKMNTSFRLGTTYLYTDDTFEDSATKRMLIINLLTTAKKNHVKYHGVASDPKYISFNYLMQT